MPTTAPVLGRAAALTRMSTPPSPATTDAAMSLTDWSSPVSALTASTVRPEAAATDSRAASRAALSRATRATSHPSAASARPTASPIPRFPPVTIARFPLSSRSMPRSSHGDNEHSRRLTRSRRLPMDVP